MSKADSNQPGSRWFSFAAYPRARQLCHEHVMGSGPRRMEIEWSSLATADSPATVVAYYERDQKAKAVPEQHGGYGIDSSSNPRDKLSIVPAKQASHYPGCHTHATPDEQTVIIVSRATGG